MQDFILFAILLFPQIISAQSNCPTACFQGTIDDAGPAVSDSLCPPAPGIINPVYTPNCLCYTPETYDGSPWLFCYMCGEVTDGDFSDICGSTPVTQTCANQQDPISEACNGDGDINTVLGDLCSDGKPSGIVAGIGAVVSFFEPPLAEGALALLGEACLDVKEAQTISSAAGDICSIWKTAGCGTVNADATDSAGSTDSSGSSKSLLLDRQNVAYAVSLAVGSFFALTVY